MKNVFKSKIIQGDTITLLKEIPKNLKFDVVIADPPYNIGKDFGNNNDNMHIDEYVNWSKKWISECFHHLSPNGLIYIYGFHEILARISVKYPIDEQRWLAWHYTNKIIPSSKFWQRSHEAILCLWKPNSKRPNLEIDQIREPYTESFLKNAAGKVRKNTKGRFGNNSDTIYKANINGAMPRDVLRVPALAGGAGRSERWFYCKDCKGPTRPPKDLSKHLNHNILKHPTQKPMDLTKKLILSRINKKLKGNLLIPFAGSGSECVLASSMNIPFLGFEINPDYVRFARSWIKSNDKSLSKGNKKYQKKFRVTS
jgi:site-specific DNA-methyltransferase (adenine-specific)